MIDKNNSVPNTRELLHIHNEQKEECRKEHEKKRLRNYILSDTMYVDSIKPECLRQEIVEEIGSGKEVIFSIYHGGRKFLEYPIQLIDKEA